MLKGQYHEIFYLWFFHQTISSGFLIHRLKPYRIWLQICEDIRQCRWLSGVNDTADAVSAVSMTNHMQKALTRASGAWGKLFDEKKTEVENLATLSLSESTVNGKIFKNTLYSKPVI
jgi:hypothetical protein